MYSKHEKYKSYELQIKTYDYTVVIYTYGSLYNCIFFPNSEVIHTKFRYYQDFYILDFVFAFPDRTSYCKNPMSSNLTKDLSKRNI